MRCPLELDLLDEIQEPFRKQRKGHPTVFTGDIPESKRWDSPNGSHYFANIPGVSSIIRLQRLDGKIVHFLIFAVRNCANILQLLIHYYNLV